MPRFAANLSMMFTEWEFLDRFAAAAEAGFDAVEFLFPYAHPAEAIADRLQRHGLTPALFDPPPGEWGGGAGGFRGRPETRAEFEASVRAALVYAEATGAKRLHMMSGHGLRSNEKEAAAYRSAV